MDAVNGTPDQASTTGGVREVVDRGALSEDRVVPQGGAVVDHGAPQGGAPPEKTGSPPVKEKAPSPLVEMHKTFAPRQRSQAVTVIPSPAKMQLVKELQRMQQHNLDVVPMQGGSYGRIIFNESGQLHISGYLLNVQKTRPTRLGSKEPSNMCV